MGRYYEGFREEPHGGYKRKEEYRQRYEEEGHGRGWDNGDRHRYSDREISPAVGSYQRHDSEVSATESFEDRKQNNTLGSASPEWSDKNVHRIQDWVEDVEEGDAVVKEVVKEQREEVKEIDRDDRPSRPNSRESRGSKGSRASRDRETNFVAKKEEKVGKFFNDHDKKPKVPKQPPVQDIRGYFRDDVVEQEKKPFRHAPGPITKEKLESFEMKESMTRSRR